MLHLAPTPIHCCVCVRSHGERSKEVRLVDGASLRDKGKDALGKVLFAARPPVRDGLETTGMMMQ